MPAERILDADTLKVGKDKLNKAIEQSNKSEVESGEAVKNSRDAVDIAGVAKQSADSTRTELDAVVVRETDSDAMSRQAAVGATGADFVNLKQRLDKEYHEQQSQISEKLTKNIGAVEPADLSQAVKEQMTGGSVAVVGVGAVNTVNVLNKAITTNKRTSLGEFAYVQMAQFPVDFNFTLNHIKFPSPAGVRNEIVHRNKVYLLPAADLIVPMEIGVGGSRGFIVFDITTNTIRVFGSTDYSQISEDMLMIGYFHKTHKIAYLNGNYKIDGVKESDVIPMLRYAFLLLGDDKPAVIDSDKKTLTFPASIFDRILYVGDKEYPNAVPYTKFVIDLSHAIGTSAWVLLFNISTKEFNFVPWNTIQQYRLTHVLLGTCRIVGGRYVFNLNFPFIQDGKYMGLIPVTTIGVVQNPYNSSVRGIAHRGYSLTAPENTLPAYKLAKEKGILTVEVDVEWTLDNIAVCLHDEPIDRTSDGTGSIRTMTLAEVKTYDFGSWKGAEFVGTKIPTFEEFIIYCKKLNLHPYIEMKGNVTVDQAQILVDIVKLKGMLLHVTWISFSVPALEKIKTLLPRARLGIVAGTLSSELIALGIALKTAENEVFLDVGYASVTEALVIESLSANLPVEVWTLNDASLVHGLVEKGVSGISTDYLNIAEILSS